MKKALVMIIASFAGLVLFLFLTKNLIAKTIVERGAERAAGLRLRMDSLDLGILSTSIRISNLRVYNPYGYQDEVMVEFPNLYLDYSLPRMLRGELYFHDINLHLGQLTVITDEKSRLNLDWLKAIDFPKEEKGQAPQLEIGKLALRLDKVIHKDYSLPDEPVAEEFNVNFSETYHDISSFSELIRLVTIRTLANTAIGKLTGFQIKGLEAESSAAISEISDIAAEALDFMDEKIKLPFLR